MSSPATQHALAALKKSTEYHFPGDEAEDALDYLRELNAELDDETLEVARLLVEIDRTRQQQAALENWFAAAGPLASLLDTHARALGQDWQTSD